MSEAIIQIADCTLIKAVDGSRADFNLAIRSLIRLCELTTSPDSWHLGGQVAIRQVTRTLKGLGEISDSRNQLSPWILDELHNLADKIFELPLLRSDDWREFLRSISTLKDNEIKAVLGGPGLAKRHNFKGANHAWEAVIIGELYNKDRLATLIVSQASAVGRCANDSDLPGMIALFEQLGTEYIGDISDSLGVRSLLASTSDNVRSCFNKNHLIASSRRQRIDERRYGFSRSDKQEP